MRNAIATLTCATLAVLLTATSSAQDAGKVPDTAPLRADPELPYSPYATGTAQTRVYWGDTHLIPRLDGRRRLWRKDGSRGRLSLCTR